MSLYRSQSWTLELLAPVPLPRRESLIPSFAHRNLCDPESVKQVRNRRGSRLGMAKAVVWLVVERGLDGSHLSPLSWESLMKGKIDL